MLIASYLLEFYYVYTASCYIGVAVCCTLGVSSFPGNHQMPHVLTYVPPSLTSRLVYALFWVIAIACKLSTDYFFMFKLLVEPSMDVVHDYALNKNKLEYFFLVCNWVVPVVVYYYSIMIWFQFFCSLVGIYLGFRLKLRRKGVNSLKDRFLAAANMFRKKAIATVEEDANAEINCASKCAMSIAIPMMRKAKSCLGDLYPDVSLSSNHISKAKSPCVCFGEETTLVFLRLSGMSSLTPFGKTICWVTTRKMHFLS